MQAIFGHGEEVLKGNLAMDLYGKCVYKPQFIDSLELADTRFALLACGRYHTVISSTDGVVYSFGSNKMGQLHY